MFQYTFKRLYKLKMLYAVKSQALSWHGVHTVYRLSSDFVYKKQRRMDYTLSYRDIYMHCKKNCSVQQLPIKKGVQMHFCSPAIFSNLFLTFIFI